MAFRDRIKELRRVRAGDLFASPRNWRTHPQAQLAALRGVLTEIGYADALLARELPDGTLELVDGHLRKELDPEQVVPVLVLDLDQDEANKLLTVLDPLAALAETNATALEGLLQELQTDDAGLQAMLDGLAAKNGIRGSENDPESEWRGMPEFENENKLGIRCIVHFENEDDRAAFEALLGQKIPTNTKAIWYPEKKRENMTVFRCRDES